MNVGEGAQRGIDETFVSVLVEKICTRPDVLKPVVKLNFVIPELEDEAHEEIVAKFPRSSDLLNFEMEEPVYPPGVDESQLTDAQKEKYLRPHGGVAGGFHLHTALNNLSFTD
jgi:hypothetical protein